LSWAAARALRRAARLLRRERSLWPWIALPFVLNVLAFAAAALLFFEHLGALATPLERWLEVPAPGHWWGYLLAGPLWLLAWAVRALLIAGFGVALYFGFTLLGAVIAAPFLDGLSERVERLAGGAPCEARRGAGAGLRRALRATVAEGQRFAFFLGVGALLFAVGLVPGAQPFAAGIGVGFAALFMPLAYTGFALDRREVPFAARRRWITSHSFEMLSFGGFALALYSVPGLSFLCLPWLVAAGTLLVLELGPPPSGR
jgi:CysZ protein